MTDKFFYKMKCMVLKNATKIRYLVLDHQESDLLCEFFPLPLYLCVFWYIIIFSFYFLFLYMVGVGCYIGISGWLSCIGTNGHARLRLLTLIYKFASATV